MSSATSIEKVRLKPDAAVSDRDADQGFRPWHFFMLASLAAATVAVVLSRRSTPEHLILMSLTVGAAGAAAAGLYRMLAPLAIRDVSRLRDRPSERLRATLELEKNLVLRSIKELEFDRAMGKLSTKDFEEIGGRLRTRAMMLMKQLDAGESGYRALIERELAARVKMKSAARLTPDATEVDAAADATDGQVRLKPDATGVDGCAACGTANDPDASFCKRCGTRLER